MSMYEICSFVGNNDMPAVLATLIQVKGHSYRKPGAAMLFYPGGTIGSLSPGCLESDLSLRVEQVWENKRVETVNYNMFSSDDMAWGEAVGCGGELEILLEPVIGELRRLLCQAKKQLDAGQSLVLYRLRQGLEYTYRMELGEEELQKFLHSGQERLIEEGLTLSIPLFPKPRLVLFGAGRDSRSVAELAARVGFRVAVTDWRENSLGVNYPAEECVLCSPGEAPRRLNITESDFVLICSHSLPRDRQFLEQVVLCRPRYLGIVGSKKRISLLTDSLNWPVDLTLHAPAGLSIGGEGPEEIAVSIVAEMIQKKRQIREETKRGGIIDENSWNLSGCGSGQTNGRIQSLA